MKQKIHYLFMLLLMLLTGVGGVKAEGLKTVTISASEKLVTYATSNNQSFVQDGVTIRMAKGDGTNAPAYNSNNEDVRLYKAASGKTTGNTLTISCESYIKKIEFTFGGKSYTASNGSFSVGEYVSENYTWSGSAKTITLTNGSKEQIRIKTMAITYEEPSSGNRVVTPIFNPAAGTYTSDQDVTITCETEGATIYYTTDGNNPTASSSIYSDPISVSETTTIKAIAIKDGMTNSAVATAEYVIKADYVTLPFNWAGGASATLAALDGVTASGLGSDYADTNAPYLVKFDGTGDYIQIKTNGQPGIVTIGVKMIGGNTTSKISVQGSADGETFTDVEELNISGAQNSTHELSTTNSFAVTDRYVRLYFTKGSNVGVGPISIEKPSIDPVISANNIEIGYDVENGAIDYEIINPVDGGVVSASTDSDWLTFASNGTTFTSTTNEAFSARTASVTLTYTYGNNKTVTKEITITQAGNPNVPGTASNPFTVTQANEFISSLDNNVNSEEVYVKGVISGIKSINVSKYERAQYYISDDGTSTEQLLVYNGYYINGAKFTANDQIQVGDNVVVYGSLVNYNGTYEVAQNNKLISLDRPVKPEAGLEYKTTEVTATRGVAFTAPELTNPNNVDVTYSSSNEAVATVNAEGAVTLLKAGETTITASFAGDANYKAGSASYTLTVTVPSHKATFFVNGQQQGEPIYIAEDDPITFPVVEEQEINGKKFVGWTTAAINGTIENAPTTLVTSATMGESDAEYYAVYAKAEGEGGQSTVSDVLTLTTTGVSGTSYTDWSGKTVTSSAVYAGQSAGGNDAIQLRSKSNSSGIVTTTSGGKLTKVVVEWNTGEGATATGRTLDVYGNNTAYTAASDLYATEGNTNQGTKLGSIVCGTSTELEISGDYQYIGLRSNDGAMYLNKISITWQNGTPATYSDYCTTVVAPVKPAKPIIFHDDGGEYEGELTVAIAGEGTIKYTLNDNGETKDYTAPFTISETTTIKAWTEQDGAKSDEVEKTFTIVEKAKGAVVEDGYYTIQTNEEKYVNVAGRKTVTLVSDTKSAGTVIRVKADEYGVKVLRSQAVDLPRYAERAMSYVPEIVKEVVKKLAANVDDPIIGEQGAELILDKFNKEFDYHLYLEGENNTYRIYGRTPSMKPVVDFYAENKELIDGRLLKVEGFVKEVLQKVVDKVGRGQSVVDMFKVKTIWQNMGGTLTEPTDDASTLKFYEEVLSSETNVWNFAYQTGMLYWEKVKGYLTENAGSLGDYGKYIEKIPQIRPNFKYYIVPSASGVDIISEGNSQITDASTAWTLTKRTGFDVTFDATLSKNNGKEMYKTLYVDFAYELPENENVKALKVESVSDAGVAVTKEITGVVPAQTPVLLMSTDVENLTKTLLLSTTDGAAVANELKGNDWLINKYKINTPQLETIFALLTKLSSSLGEKYEYLKLKNSGTVNNKYFFGLSVPTKEGDFKEAFMNGKIKVLTNGEKGLGFYSNCDKNLVGNEVFMFSEDFNPILLTLKGDVNRDGKVSVADVTALVNIILGKATEGDTHNYDFEAAHVNADEDITIADVTALVNIILGK
jgi:hypothetical protein